ncbi:MAG: DUF2520 domain-containing protein [Planctomycetes bacterium]|nr:DUF2520 domain-containing protein [Planctomycetota bacterium]
MVVRVLIVGPGRVGVAFAARLRAAGTAVLGLVGRDAARTSAAAASVGVAVADWSALAAAPVVVFAVGDPELPGCLEQAAAHGPWRRAALWLHTSGRYDLTVFDGRLPAGCRRGALHPVLPFADAVAGAAAMPGAPAVLLGDAKAMRCLRLLAGRLGLVPMVADGGDRTLYHAACALAANGLTALFGAVERTFAAAGGLAVADQRRLADALLAAALRECRARGAAAALSGPVRRGDAATVALHRQRLAASAPEQAELYRALMRAALPLARAAGLAAGPAQAVAAALE